MSPKSVELASMPSPSDAVAEYLSEALDVIEANSLVRDSVDWTVLRERTLELARGSVLVGDTHPAIRSALRDLGDNHSFLIPPSDTFGQGTSREGGGVGVESDLIDDRWGFLSIPGYDLAPPDLNRRFAEEIQEQIRELDQGDVSGWVIDLRENPGGNMWPMLAGVGPILGEGVVGYFVGPDGARAPWSYDGGVAYRDSEEAVAVVAPYVLNRPEPPVAVLTGPATTSSGEAIVVAFRRRVGARSFGAGTAGLSTSNTLYELSDGAVLALTTAVFADRSGNLYGSTIEPDEFVALGPPDTPLSRDPVVQAAVSWLESQAPCS